MRLHSGAFFFAQGSLVSFRLALNVFVQGFFFWRRHDERQRVYASGFAACKKRRGKLWQKERELDDASPLDKAIIVKKFRTHLHPGFVPVCRMPLQSERSRAIMPL